MRAKGVFCHVHLLPQLPLRGICHEGSEAGEIECEHPSLLAFLLSRVCGGIPCSVRQSVELTFVSYVQLKCFGLFQQVLREL